MRIATRFVALFAVAVLLWTSVASADTPPQQLNSPMLDAAHAELLKLDANKALSDHKTWSYKAEVSAAKVEPKSPAVIVNPFDVDWDIVVPGTTFNAYGRYGDTAVFAVNQSPATAVEFIFTQGAACITSVPIPTSTLQPGYGVALYRGSSGWLGLIMYTNNTSSFMVVPSCNDATRGSKVTVHYAAYGRSVAQSQSVAFASIFP